MAEAVGLLGQTGSNRTTFRTARFDPRQILRRVGVKDRDLVAAVSDLSLAAARKQPYWSWMRNRAAITVLTYALNRRSSFPHRFPHLTL
jgi:hypothetical protein